MHRPIPEPPSPCCHRCGFRDGCCLNCFRSLEEVRAWQRMSGEEKRRVMDEAAHRRLAAGRAPA